MNEVEVGFVRYALKHGVGNPLLYLVPTHMGNLQSPGKLSDSPGNKIEALVPATFFGSGKKNLQSDTDPEEGTPLSNVLADRLNHPQRLKVLYSITGRANTRQDNCLSVEQFIGAAGYLCLVTQPGNSISYAA